MADPSAHPDAQSNDKVLFRPIVPCSSTGVMRGTITPSGLIPLPPLQILKQGASIPVYFCRTLLRIYEKFAYILPYSCLALRGL